MLDRIEQELRSGFRQPPATATASNTREARSVRTSAMTNDTIRSTTYAALNVACALELYLQSDDRRGVGHGPLTFIPGCVLPNARAPRGRGFFIQARIPSISRNRALGTRMHRPMRMLGMLPSRTAE